MRSDQGHGGGGSALDVHAEIDARVQGAGGDNRHDGHKGFATHRAIPDGPGIPFTGDELGRRAAGDERVKTGNRPAGNGDETERKNLSSDDQAGTVNELRQCGHLQIGQEEQDAKREREDRAELHERAEVIARREQQPHRQAAGDDAVANDNPGDREVAQAKDLGPVLIFVNQFAAPHRQQQQRNAKG